MTIETVVRELRLALALLAVILVLLLALYWRVKHRPPVEPGDPDEPPPGGPPRQVPDAVRPAELDGMLGMHLAGRPADGSSVPTDAAPRVVWVEHGDEAIFHVDSVKTAIVEETLLVSLDLETDQTGRQTLVVPLSVGSDPDGGITIACEAAPRGPEVLVQRWGETALQAVIAAVLELIETHARERVAEPASLHIEKGRLRFSARASSLAPKAAAQSGSEERQ